MKTRNLLVAAVGLLLFPTISFAQNAENPNPYAIFGRAPYMAGERQGNANAAKVFVIENAAEGSAVVRMEHNPQTRHVKLFDKHGKLLKEKLLKAGENGWPTQDRFAEKYYHLSPYSFCAGNPMRNVDMNGDSLMITDMASLMSIYHGLAPGQNVTFKMDNGWLEPTSFADAAANSNDFFLKDLYEIAQNPKIVEMSTADCYAYLDQNGAIGVNTFENAPFDANTKDFGLAYEQLLLSTGDPIGRSIVGNLGRTLVPKPSISRSTNGNIQVVINAKGNQNHRTVGAAHEFGHVLLYMRGLPYQHNQAGVDPFIYKRSNAMSRRLGYDY